MKSRHSFVCNRNSSILIIGEPPSIKSYDKRYLSQFSTVLTFRPDLEHPNQIRSQAGLPWFVGMRSILDEDGRRHWEEDPRIDYDYLKSDPPLKKDRLVSVVTSGKTMTAGHRSRLEFVKRLRVEFGSDVDIFAPDEMECIDKWDAISRYQYHIAIENSVCDDYWTEKLADTFLGGAFPLYHGCPNYSDYFPSDSLCPIDIRFPDVAIRSIRRAIEGNSFQNAGPAIREARRRVLDEHNFFPLVAKMCKRIECSGSHEKIIIWPEKKHPLDVQSCFYRSIDRVVNKIKGRGL